MRKPDTKGLRLFLAVSPDEALVGAMRPCLAKLANRLPGVSWVAPHNLHLTLRFLGAVDAERLHTIGTTAAQAVVGQTPIACQVTGMGAFPSPQRPAVIWAGIHQEAGQLTAFAERLRGALVEAGFGRDKHPFSPHVTLGRVRRGRSLPQQAFNDILEAHAEECFGSWQVDRLTLMHSTLTPSGPVYTPLAHWEFAARVPPEPR